MTRKFMRAFTLCITLLSSILLSVASENGTAEKGSIPNSEGSQTKFISDPSGMQIEVVSEPNKPTKVLVAEPPKSKEPTLQQPHNWSPDDPKSPRTAGKIDKKTTQVPAGKITGNPNDSDSGSDLSDPALKPILAHLHELNAQYQDSLTKNADLRGSIDQHKAEWQKNTIESMVGLIEKLFDAAKEGHSPDPLPKNPKDFLDVIKSGVDTLNNAFKTLNDIWDDKTTATENDLLRQKIDDDLTKTNAALNAVIENSQVTKGYFSVDTELIDDPPFASETQRESDGNFSIRAKLVESAGKLVESTDKIEVQLNNSKSTKNQKGTTVEVRSRATGFWDFMESLGTLLNAVNQGIQAYEQTKAQSLSNQPGAARKSPSPSSTTGPTPLSGPRMPPSSGGTCEYVPNPEAVACLNSPTLINGRANYCNHYADGSYIPLMIKKCH